MDTVLNCIGDVSQVLRQTLEHLIDEGLIRSALYKQQTASTNSDAAEDLQSESLVDSAHLPRLYLSDLQTAGRGRQGNAWQSDNDALTFSLVVPVDLTHPSAALLSPAVGVAVAKAIEFSYGPCRIGLKWPNDLCIYMNTTSNAAGELRKLGGILIESVASVQRQCIIGIGLNLNRTPDLDGLTNTPPASLAEACAKEIRRDELLASLIESLSETLDEFDSRPNEILNEYRLRCVLTGKHLSLKHGGEQIAGYCTGITDEGSLELIAQGTRHHFRSGEVQRVRPV